MNWTLSNARRIVDGSRNMPVVSLVAVMMLVLILLWANLTWIIIAPIQVLVVAGLLFEKIRTDPRFWCVMTALLAGAIYWDWYPLDNHQYLFVYLSLALFCVFHLPEKRRKKVLALSGRILLGAVMAAAVIWKAVTPDYLDGTFFHHALLTHPHLQNIAIALGGISPEIISTNEEQLHLLHFSYLTSAPVESVTLQGASRIAPLALFITWWTIGVEALLAVLFLWPRRLGGDHRFVFLARHITLILFITAIYPLAPVIGFGWALIILGFANCAEKPTIFRPIYIALMLFLLFAGYVNFV